MDEDEAMGARGSRRADGDGERAEDGGDDMAETPSPEPRVAPLAEAEAVPDDDASSEEEHFDISLAASHSYLGPGMEPVRGRNVLEPGWTGRVPVIAPGGLTFPGETVPMMLGQAEDSALLLKAIKKDRLFGLVQVDETGRNASGFGVLCEVFEAMEGGAEVSGAVSFKARVHHRMRLIDMPVRPAPIELYHRVVMARVLVLPEPVGGAPLPRISLSSLDQLRRGGRTPADRRLRTMDAALTPWPLFVHDIFNYDRLRAIIEDYFTRFDIDGIPGDPVALSFWVARNVPLSFRSRLAIFAADSALLRLHMEVKDIAKASVLCCVGCNADVAHRNDVYIMTSDGVGGHYTNEGGYVHDIVTVHAASHVRAHGQPSEAFSWFPGYTWTIIVCDVCGAHLGWQFDAVPRKLLPRRFFGLCRNSVQPSTEDTPPASHAPSPFPFPLRTRLRQRAPRPRLAPRQLDPPAPDQHE